jgi:cytochrome P450
MILFIFSNARRHDANILVLTATRQVFMETLRYYTVAPLLPRMMNESDRLGDYRLPAGSTVLVFYHGVHHNPSVWKDPHIFDPDRFAPGWKAEHHSFAFSPFSAGPRKCAGDEFAMLEGALAIALLLQRYQINLVPGQTFVGKLGATMHPRDGVKATLRRRASLPEPAIRAADEMIIQKPA